MRQFGKWEMGEAKFGLSSLVSMAFLSFSIFSEKKKEKSEHIFSSSDFRYCTQQKYLYCAINPENSSAAVGR